MWHLFKGEYFLPNTSIAKLKRLYNKEAKAKPKLRLLCAIQRKKGFSIDDISKNIDIPRRTVHGLLTRFQTKGIKAKDSIKQTGRPSELSKKQLDQLEKVLIKGPHKCGYTFQQLWTRRLIEDYVKRKYKVSYTDRHIRRLLVGLGFSFVKPRRKHYKSADKRSIERFKKTLEKESYIGNGRGSQFFAWMKVR